MAFGLKRRPVPLKMKLAVITTYYNEAEIIDETVAALLATDTAFDFYLVDDCSPLPPVNVLEKLEGKPWFHYIRNARNMGAVPGLNRAIGAAIDNGADLIAINDADDIPYPNRFRDQIAAFKADPALGIVGGGADMVDYETDTLLWQTHHPASDAAIRRASKRNSSFVHSTVVFRAEVFRKAGFYKAEAYAYDYDMISRALRAGFKAANVPSVVLKYNIRLASMSVSKRRTQVASRIRVQLENFEFLNLWSYIGLARSALAFAAPNNASNGIKAFIHRLKSARGNRGAASS